MIECSICLNEEIEDLNKCINNCGHVFCKTCLDTWLNRGNDDCPLCRQKIEYFEYRNEKYRLINISRQTNPLSRVQTVFRTHPNLLLVIRVMGLILSVGVLLQAYFIYNLHKQNIELKEKHDNDISTFVKIMRDNNYINSQQTIGINICKFFNNCKYCLMPKYFVNKCFNT